MAAIITDLLDRVSDSNTGRPIIATLAAPGKAIGASSLNLAAATNWTTTTAIHFTIYNTVTVGSTVVKDPTSQTDWKGTLAGTTISGLTITGGTDRAYTAGAIVELAPTSRYAKDLYDWGITAHNQDGTHKAFTESNIVPTAAIQDNAITAAKISAASITSAKLNFGGAGAGIWWEEIGRATLASTATSFTVSSLPARKYLKAKVLAIPSSTSTIDLAVRFNSDTGTNYSYRAGDNGSPDNVVTSSTALLTSVSARNTLNVLELDIINISTVPKAVYGTSMNLGTDNTSGTTPEHKEVRGKWTNASAAINSITISASAGGTYAVGTEIVVLGHD